MYGKCESFVMQMLHVCVLCASCGSAQCCVLHDFQFVNAVIHFIAFMVPYHVDVDCYFDIADKTPLSPTVWISSI